MTTTNTAKKTEIDTNTNSPEKKAKKAAAERARRAAKKAEKESAAAASSSSISEKQVTEILSAPSPLAAVEALGGTKEDLADLEARAAAAPKQAEKTAAATLAIAGALVGGSFVSAKEGAEILVREEARRVASEIAGDLAEANGGEEPDPEALAECVVDADRLAEALRRRKPSAKVPASTIAAALAFDGSELLALALEALGAKKAAAKERERQAKAAKASARVAASAEKAAEEKQAKTEKEDAKEEAKAAAEIVADTNPIFAEERASARHSLAVRSALVSAWKAARAAHGVDSAEAKTAAAAELLALVVRFAPSARAGAVAKATAKTKDPIALEILGIVSAAVGSAPAGKRARGTSPVVKTRYSRADRTDPKAKRYVIVTVSPEHTRFDDEWTVTVGVDSEGRKTITLTKTAEGPEHAVRS